MTFAHTVVVLRPTPDRAAPLSGSRSTWNNDGAAIVAILLLAGAAAMNCHVRQPLGAQS
jgi:hypothetical protein